LTYIETTDTAASSLFSSAALTVPPGVGLRLEAAVAGFTGSAYLVATAAVCDRLHT
jgi:hypothetical protein